MIGEPKHPGTLLYGVSGRQQACIYELPSGTLLTDIIYKYAGGTADNKKNKNAFSAAHQCLLFE
jgi:NADH-quinone oxidoreductase subunit F